MGPNVITDRTFITDGTLLRLEPNVITDGTFITLGSNYYTCAFYKDSYFDVNKRNLIVFDDQMIDASKDKRIVNLFTRGYHHRNLSVIYIVQNLFHQGKGSHSISLNSHSRIHETNCKS